MHKVLLTFFILALSLQGNASIEKYIPFAVLKDSAMRNPNWILQNIDSNYLLTLNEDTQRYEYFLLRGMVHKVLTENPQSIIEYSKASEIATEIKDTGRIIQSINAITTPYFFMGKYDECFELYLQSLKLAEQYKPCKYRPTATLNVANMYYYLKEKEKCLEQQHKAYFIATTCLDTAVQSKSSRNIAAIFTEKGNVDSATYWMKKGIDLIPKNSYGDLSNAYCILSGNYYGDEYQNERLYYLKKSLDYGYRSGDSTTMAFTYISFARYHAKYGSIDTAIQYIGKSVHIYRKNNLVDGIQHALGIMAEISKQANDIDDAIRAWGEVQQIRDTLYSMETAARKAQFETLYETEKKEKENAILREDNLKQQQANQRIFLGSIILILILSLGGLIAYFRSKAKQREKVRLLEKERFKAVVSAEENERIRIARELHDGLGQMLSVAKMNVSSIENKTGAAQIKTIDNSLDLIDQAVKEVRHVSHNLMPASLMKVGLQSALTELVEKINTAGQIKVELKMEGMEDRLPSNFEITIYRVIQEVMNNALKHSLAKDIFITLIKKENKLHLTIRDNGVGFETGQIEKSKGIGWKNIFSRISMLGGQINVDSKKDFGSTVAIVLPVN